MVELQQFLKDEVESVLDNDLKELARDDVKVGYPLLMATFAGIELLGGLMSPGDFSPSSGKRYFCHYWATYLYRGHANSSQIGKAVYELARNGLAHVFFPKGPIAIGRRLSGHLALDPDGRFYVDGAKLADDLKASYERHVKPAATRLDVAPNAASMQRQLNGLPRFRVPITRLLGRGAERLVLP